MSVVIGVLGLSLASPGLLLAQQNTVDSANNAGFSLVDSKSAIALLAQSLSAQSLSELPDGAYQFCTEPDPQDEWDGAGLCLYAIKHGSNLDGYYGYPHSDSFVCLQGELSDGWLKGQGMVFTWGDVPDPAELQADAAAWDLEERLWLGEGRLVQIGTGDETTDWILYQQASLNTQGLYQYPSPRMTPPEQLCDWR